MDFEEGAGPDAGDSSGYGNNGTFSGLGVGWNASGHVGKALVFDGIQGVVVIPDSPSLNPSLEISMEAWIYPTSLTGERIILNKESEYEISLQSGVPAVAVQGVGPAAWYWLGGGAVVPVNTWSHVLGTYDGVTLRMFVNGVQTAMNVDGDGRIVRNTNPLSIGARGLQPGGNPAAWFAGSIDEVRIFARAK